MTRIFKQPQHISYYLISVVVLLLGAFSPIVHADGTDSPCGKTVSAQDCAAIVNNWPNWVPDNGAGSCGGESTLNGGDNAEKTWNYFIAKGLDNIHVAAIMGNFQQESGFNPERVQDGYGPATSPNPGDAGAGGWGLAQWTPGSKITSLLTNFNISGNISDLSTQLNLVWAEMENGPTPTGYSNFLNDFKATSDLTTAVLFVTKNFEGPSVVGPRQQFAEAALKKYGGGAAGATQTTSTSTCSSQAPDCSAASGTAKILCAAEAYNTVSYLMGGGHGGAAAWHQSCPVIGPSCSLDCSGLVNIAVYDAFQQDINEDTDTERANIGKYWKQVPLSQVQPGDLIQPETEHVEIIDHVQGNTLYTFGAHTDGIPQPNQVGPAQYTASPDYLYLHYIGPGA